MGDTNVLHLGSTLSKNKTSLKNAMAKHFNLSCYIISDEKFYNNDH